MGFVFLLSLGMDELLRLLDNVQKVTPEKLFQASIDELTLAQMEDLNRDQLNKQHIDSLGEPLFSEATNSGTYSAATEQITGGEKTEGEPYDLNDTGKFQDSIKATKKAGAVDMTADPVRGDTNLFNDFNPQIVGLTEENIDKIAKDEILPRAQAAFIKIITS